MSTNLISSPDGTLSGQRSNIYDWAVLFCYSIGMVEQDTALLIIIVMLLGNILNVLCKILNKL